MKIGYKGFDKNLKCKGEQFEIGQTYQKSNGPLKLCSNSGWHYCNELVAVFKHYSFTNTTNRYCKIEILGDFLDEDMDNPFDDDNKSITNHFKILEELDRNEIEKVYLSKRLNLNTIKQIQSKYPTFHVGGSAGLFLHGVVLSRWFDSDWSDLDLVAPYYIMPESDKESEIEITETKCSGNDFDESFLWNGVQCDFRIDPKQKYEIIEYDGFRFKVSLLETILEAKVRYSLGKNGKKHKDDIYEICGKKPIKK